jgi:hypothetical protein
MKQVLFRCKKGYLKVNECADDQKELPSNVKGLMVYHPVEVPEGFFPECVECQDNDDEGLYLGNLKKGDPKVEMYKSCSIDIEMVE